jgi:hypothetical protein
MSFVLLSMNLAMGCTRPNPKYLPSSDGESLDALQVATDGVPAMVDARPAVTDGPASGASFKVGSFLRTAGTQVVPHGLGEIPKALLLWTVDKSNATASADYRIAIGISDGPNSSRSISAASQDGVSPSNSSRRMAAKALTITQWGKTVVAEADLSGWDATRFTLAWTSTGTGNGIVHYVVIGGPAVQAKLIEWLAATPTGTKVVTGVGFKPTAVLHIYLGAYTEDPLPTNITDANIGWGVMDSVGAQWSVHASVRSGRSTRSHEPEIPRPAPGAPR